MSVNIKTDYGAVGDGQIQTINASFTSGLNTLTVFSNIFVAGDVNKYICVSNWFAPSGANPSGGQGASQGTANGTISSISTPWNGTFMILILGGPAAGQTVTNASTTIEWGSDDTPAFTAFNTAQSANNNVTLIIPAGRYECVTGGAGGSVAVGQGIPILNVTGTGAPTLSDLLGGGDGIALNFNGAPLFNNNTDESLIQTVAAGSTTLTCITASDASKYTVNAWSWMTGYDTQGFGSPPNPLWGEFVFVTAINSSTGVITIQSPLKNSYESVWPKWVTGGPTAFSLGGPATLYLIKSTAWNVAHVWDGINFRSTPTLLNCGARSMTIKNSTFESFGPNCSFQQTFTADTVVVPTLWELDKATEVANIVNSTVRGLLVQSASPYQVNLTNTTVQDQNSNSTNKWSVSGSTLPTDVAFGPSSYGLADTVTVSNTTFAGQTGFNYGGSLESNLTTTGQYSCSGGVITRPVSGGTGEPPQWAFPGKYFVISSRHSIENPAWKCLDIFVSGSTLVITTDQTGGFPSPVSPATDISAAPAPPIISFSNNTGCDDAVSWSNVVGGRPLYSQWDLTYNGNIGAPDPSHQIKVAGLPIFIKITVNAGYSAGTFNLGVPFSFLIAKPQNTEVTWDPVIDLTTPGVRTITPAGVTGSAGADSGLAFPNSGNVWLVPDQMIAAMSSVVGSGSVRLQIQANMGFGSGTSVTPLSLRLHS